MPSFNKFGGDREGRAAARKQRYDELINALQPKQPELPPMPVAPPVEEDPGLFATYAPSVVRGGSMILGAAPVAGGLFGVGGELIAQGMEKGFGTRDEFDPTSIASQGLLGLIGGGTARAIGKFAGKPLAAAAAGAAGGAASPTVDALAHGEAPDVGDIAFGAGVGGVTGGALAALLGRLNRAPAKVGNDFVVEQAGWGPKVPGGTKTLKGSGDPMAAPRIPTDDLDEVAKVPYREAQPENFPGPRQQKIMDAERKAAEAEAKAQAKIDAELAAQREVDAELEGLEPAGRSASRTVSDKDPLTGATRRVTQRFAEPAAEEGADLAGGTLIRDVAPTTPAAAPSAPAQPVSPLAKALGVAAPEVAPTAPTASRLSDFSFQERIRLQSLLDGGSNFDESVNAILAARTATGAPGQVDISGLVPKVPANKLDQLLRGGDILMGGPGDSTRLLRGVEPDVVFQNPRLGMDAMDPDFFKPQIRDSGSLGVPEPTPVQAPEGIPAFSDTLGKPADNAKVQELGALLANRQSQKAARGKAQPKAPAVAAMGNTAAVTETDDLRSLLTGGVEVEGATQLPRNLSRMDESPLPQSQRLPGEAQAFPENLGASVEQADPSLSRGFRNYVMRDVPPEMATDMAGARYRAFKEGLPEGMVEPGMVRQAGANLQRTAKDAGLPIGAAARQAAPPAPAPDAPAQSPLTLQSMLEKVKSLGRRPGGAEANNLAGPGFGGSETGAIDTDVALRTALGLGGALAGGAMNPDDPLLGAAGGFAAGMSIPAVAKGIPKLAARLSSSDPTMTPIATEIAQAVGTPEGIRDSVNKFLGTVPQALRFNFLASPNIVNNAFVAPWSAGVAKGIELHIAGDPRGAQILADMTPTNWGRMYAESLEEAKSLITNAERSGFGPSYAEAETPLGKLFAAPGTVMSAGDLATRRTLMKFGLSEEEARMATLTSDPELQFMKSLVNLQRSAGPVGQIFQPFARTVANIAEQGAHRTPILGSITQSFRPNPDTMAQQLRMQGLGGVALGAGAGAGYASNEIEDPSLKRFLRSFATNAVGPYSALTAAGFAGGTAAASGSKAGDIAYAAGRQTVENVPIPSPDVVLSWGRGGRDLLNNDLSGESIPSGFFPGQSYIKDALSSSGPSSRSRRDRRDRRDKRETR